MRRAIIQAGGKGTRLYPYTCVLPKPLMPIQEMPILEIVIRQLVFYGFRSITISVGHLGHLIMAVIGDGERWGAKIDYHQEEEPRGTLGALKDMSGLDKPFLVMNGDLLTDLNFREFFDGHMCSDDCKLTVATYRKPVPISLGVFEFDQNQNIVGFREKPVLQFPCSMGIYAMHPSLIDVIPTQGVFGFDSLMGVCLGQKLPVRAHLFDGSWLDIGRPEDYEEAGEMLQKNRARFLPTTPDAKDVR